MKPGQHEEGGTVNSGRQLQIQLMIGMNIFGRLQAHEDDTEQNRNKEEQGGSATFTCTYGVVRDRDRYA